MRKRAFSRPTSPPSGPGARDGGSPACRLDGRCERPDGCFAARCGDRPSVRSAGGYARLIAGRCADCRARTVGCPAVHRGVRAAGPPAVCHAARFVVPPVDLRNARSAGCGGARKRFRGHPRQTSPQVRPLILQQVFPKVLPPVSAQLDRRTSPPGSSQPARQHGQQVSPQVFRPRLPPVCRRIPPLNSRKPYPRFFPRVYPLSFRFP